MKRLMIIIYTALLSAALCITVVVAKINESQRLMLGALIAASVISVILLAECIFFTVSFAKKKKSAGSVDGHCLTKEECRKRWRKMIKLFGAPNKYSIRDISLAIGLKSDSGMNGFIYKYGIELANKYGKLPYKEGLRMPIWSKIMEAKV